MNHGALLLTSTGLSTDTVVRQLKNLIQEKREPVAIITTAAEEKELNKYAQLAHTQFIDLGFTDIEFIDLQAEPTRDFSKYGIIYVCGGNTFTLLKFAREAHFKETIKNLLEKDGTYIGVSAGSIILGRSIDVAGEVLDDKNDVDLKDLAGLDLVGAIILPHYSSELEKKTKIFEKKYGVTVERISNSQGILIKNGQKTIIE